MLHDSAADSQKSSIAECFTSCSDAFKRFYIALASDDCQHVQRTTLLRISDEYGRLGVWGANSAADRVGRGSLDDILRDDPDLRSIVLELLKDFNHDLEIGISLARKPKESDGGASCEEMKDNQSSLESESDSESISSMSSSSDVISPGSLKDPQETVEIRRLISSVFGSIRSLYKLSTLLKRPSIPTKYLRSSTSGMSHSHRLSGYEYWDQKHVEEKMKQWAFDTNQSYEGPIDSNYFLTARLAAANTGRRRQLKYWQKNPDYQPEENRTSEPLRRQDESKVDLTSVQQSLRKPLPAKSQSEAITTPSGPTIQSFSTVPLTLLNDNETFSGRPRTIYAPSAAGGKRSRVPDAPRLPVGAHATQCPYCFTPLDATSVRKRDLWKKHVFRDLRPYICTFQHCQNPDKMFVTRHDWWYHEMQMHRRRWICAGNCNQNFKSKASIESHMREAHSQTFAELQLPVLIDMCERPENPNEAAECPLCPQEITVSGLEAHLGFHLEELALFVIPINQDDSSEDGGSDRAVGAAENLDRPDSDTLSSLGSFLESRTQHSGTFETNEAFAKFIQSNKNPAEPAVQNWLDTDGENYLITERAGPGDDTLDVVTTLQKPTENLSLIPVTNPKSFLPDFESSGAQAVRLPCFSVPDARNSEFLGREDVLQLIDEQFFPSGEEETATKTRKNMHSFLIYGIGGIGKTQVATEYAHSRMDKFDAIFWLCANERSILAEQFATIAVDLGLEKHGSEAKSLTASCALVQAWLSRPLKSFDDPHTTASWLIVFDALDDFDILEDYLPLSSHGSVLITSRNQVTEMSPYVERAFLLPPFTIQEGVIFLEHLTRGLPIDKESLHVITQKAGGQPLVIKQMADIMVDLQISSKDFLLLYEQVGAEQFTQDQDKSTSLWYDRSLATVWALDRLSVKTLTLLEVMSLLEADRIPEFILIEGCQDVTLSGFPESPAVYYEARAQLLRSSLITYNTERQVLRLHRVVQDTVRAQMNNRQLSSIFQAALALISKVWPFQTLIKRHNVARRAKCAQIFPCVLRLKQVFTEQVVQNKSFEPDYSFAELLNDAGGYLLERGLIQESKSYFDLVEWICEQSESRTSEAVTQILRLSHANQTAAACETNDREGCLEHAMIWLQMVLERKGPSGTLVIDYELGQVYNEIGIAYGLQEMWDTAAEHFIKSIGVLKELENYRDTMLGLPAPNLGLVYWIQGRLEESEHVLVEILEIQAANFGVDDTESFRTGKILHALGNLYTSQGRMNESLDFHTRALKQYMATLGQGHHRTADVCHRLAMHYMRLNHLIEAEKLLDQALKVFSGNSCYKPELARTMFKKSQLLEMVGRSDESIIACTEAISLRNSLVINERKGSDVGEEDFNSLVAFWSR